MEEESFVEVAEGLVGELEAMCSVAEAQLRTETRQVDRFELAANSNGEIVIDFNKAVKKYQRSSADKKYIASEVRTLEACWKTVEYLTSTLLDFDVNPKPGFAETCYSKSSFFEIYSFLRDRLRAVRVDLHVQNASGTPIFIAVHELCLRFELLSLFLLWGRDFGQSEDRKFDLHLSLTALSQTIDPLSNAYKKRRAQGPVSANDTQREAEITSYVLLLALTSRTGSKTFKSHYLKQPCEIKLHPLVIAAFETVSAYYSGHWVEFLQKFTSSSFLSCCCLLPVVNTARMRVLWRTVRTNRPFFVRKDPNAGPMPPPRPERLSVDRLRDLLGFGTERECKQFLTFVGLDCTENGVCSIPPRQLTRNPINWWMSSSEWRTKTQDMREFPEFAWDATLQEAFHSRIGEDVGDERPPDRCDYPKQVELMLEMKYKSELETKLTRRNIVSGVGGEVSSSVPTTPLVTPIVIPQPVQEPKLAVLPTFFPDAPAAQPFVFAAPSKPERPAVPLEPLTDVQKRPRDSPEKLVLPVEKPPAKKLHEEIEQAVAVIAPPPAPMPSLPCVDSGFELLAAELDRVVINRDQPSPQIVALELMEEDQTRELVIGERRSKFVALKCLRNWNELASESHRWKWMLGSTSRAPARLNP